MDRLTAADAARRAGVEPEFLDELVKAGVINPAPDGSFVEGDVRRTSTVRALTGGGVALDGLAAAMREGKFTLDFLDTDTYDRLAAFSDETFAQAAQRTGLPFELLALIREAFGGAVPEPSDRIREDELVVVPFLEMQVAHGFRTPAIERFLRTVGESLARVADAEAEWWYTEVIEPRQSQGLDLDPAFSFEMSRLGEKAILAIFHGQENRSWMSNITRGIEEQLAAAGLHTRLERPPAICFLDVTGYTRLTQERGDEVAAHLAEELARVVTRTSLQHGGRPIKWLGDGVMFWFRDPGPAVLAALRMVEGVGVAGLPPAHVGVHSGPVLFQQGDYFGQTVNVAARIADFARPGEVLVSQAVVDIAREPEVRFSDIGPVELKGVQGTTHLQAAHLASG